MSLGRFLLRLELGPKNPSKPEFASLLYQSCSLNGENIVGAVLPVPKNEKELVEEFDRHLKEINKDSKYPHTLIDSGVTDEGNLTPNISTDNPQDFYHKIVDNYNLIKSNIKTISEVQAVK